MLSGNGCNAGQRRRIIETGIYQTCQIRKKSKSRARTSKQLHEKINVLHNQKARQQG